MVIYLDDYRAKKMAQSAALRNGTYDDEVLDANWNSAAIYMFKDVAQNVTSPELPEDLSTIDIDEFLRKVYVLAAQI